MMRKNYICETEKVEQRKPLSLGRNIKGEVQRKSLEFRA